MMDIGFASACLATPYAQRLTNGWTVDVDGGVGIMS
jgi:hypothetical protein